MGDRWLRTAHTPFWLSGATPQLRSPRRWPRRTRTGSIRKVSWIPVVADRHGPLRLQFGDKVPMNRIASLVLLMLVATQARPGSLIRLRVLSYNIHHGEGTDRRFNLARLAGVIERVQPDLVALQEVDVGTERSGGQNQLAELA